MSSILAFVWSIVWWVLSTLLWALVWIALPFAVAAYIGVRVAEAALGRDVVRAWLRTKSKTLATGLGRRLSAFLLALSALPFRVVAWLAIYTVWHSIVSLMWTPRWKPWPRAWAKRWGGEKPPRPATKPAAAKPAKAGAAGGAG
jgi:hypothetical protein